jgi:hypothetical protein
LKPVYYVKLLGAEVYVYRNLRFRKFVETEVTEEVYNHLRTSRYFSTRIELVEDQELEAIRPLEETELPEETELLEETELPEEPESPEESVKSTPVTLKPRRSKRSKIKDPGDSEEE